YRVTHGGPYLMLTDGNRAAVTIAEGSRRAQLLSVSHCRIPLSCATYGPTYLNPGEHSILSVDGPALGPLVEASELSLAVLRGNQPDVAGMSVVLRPEQVDIQGGVPSSS